MTFIGSFLLILAVKSGSTMTYTLSCVFCMTVVRVGGNPQLFDSSGKTGLPNGFRKQSAVGLSSAFGSSFIGSNSLVGGAAVGNLEQGVDYLREALPGEPGLDYPIYSLPAPETSFDCSDKV